MATRNFLVDIDLFQNEIQNVVIQHVATNPTSGKEGQIVYNTTDDYYYLCTASQSGSTNATWSRIVDARYTATTSRAGLVELATDAEVTTGTDTTRYMSVKQIMDAINGAVQGGMHFKGAVTATTSGGTSGTVYNPSTKAVGDQWIIIKDESDPQHVLDELTVQTGSGTTDNAKAGDTVICTDAANNYWTIIPSGDEPEGTVTSITVTTPTGLKVNGGTSAEITTSGTFALTCDTTGGYEIPKTTDLYAFSKISDGTNIAEAEQKNDTLTVTGSGATTVTVTAGTDTMTIASTDEKVKQEHSTNNAEYSVILRKTSGSGTSATTEGVQFDADVKVNPSTGTLTATKLSAGTITDTGLTASKWVKTNANKELESADLPVAGSGQAGIIAIGTGATDAAAGNHTHGNITTDGKITTTSQANDVTPASGDKLLMTDSSDSTKIVRSSIDASSVATAVTNSHTHSTLTLSKTAQTYATVNGTAYKLSLPSSNPYREEHTNAAASFVANSTTGTASWAITHSLGVLPQVSVYDANGKQVEFEVTATTTTVTLTKNGTTVPAANAYTVVLIG